ncbi:MULTISPECIES: helicase-exonuclease AddAB subunit AddB [Hungatella]|jgi:ATP-dependent helicase/nuclease subunit B|uniref:ATP-dependent helicase/deoxyribonuclease subunit B n=1 Tax=Hungatella hathewayi TaxID=154046 RepID=A0A413X7R3_9FIRM|nr:helicase-exonuclease AddAB subunit AddB [Hungatella hathewayi]RGZ01052.1 helicase-exonuclease AddAB subunit AddB [Hungatella hathewayi]RHB72579.1 helicase-exonuclease AddAB subunit AddB [Hungatella hathewayi]GKH02179.1 ATP-dependent helicase/deoxyribonuclease subunit B [Hungatella hathewayi]GKH09790.1 ATP-dependent helicase/deoxyribonuclease subunit B [Hungatella hathewayi]
MSIQLLLGGSGSGKTHRLYTDLIKDSMENPDTKYFAIVPEQFTMQTQKEIVTLHPNHGVMNIDIVSFQRLAYRVFEELAIVNPDVLDDMGKSMILRKVTGGKQKELPLYQSHLNQNGFIGQLKSMLSELYQYGITPDMLEAKIPETTSPMLRQKLEDISVIYKAFQEYIRDRYITTEEILDVLCRHLPESKLIRDSVITLDGYTGFTPVQYRLLDLFLRYSRRVVVTVTVDPAVPERGKRGVQDLFYMSCEMIDKLNALARQNHVKREPDIVLDEHPAVRYRRGAKRRAEQEARVERKAQAGQEALTVSPASSALDFLEQNLYRYSGRVYSGKAEEIRLVQAVNPAEEISCVVREIGKMLREGYRYRDMAVITGDIGSFAGELIHQFDASEIPYFLDDKKSILKNPMVELVRAALETIQKDFSYETMFRYLRTGLVVKPEDERKLDRLENYVIAMGIRGHKRWNTPWEGWYRGGRDLNLEELNQLREEIMAPLTAFIEAFREEGRTVRTMSEAVVRLLEALSVEEKMLARESAFQEQGEFGLSKEYGQVYGLVVDLMDRLARLLGEEKVSRREYAEILDAGFSEIEVGLIPAAVDRIVVGDITRTRLDHIKILFFIGVNDGIVPQKKENSSLFTDKEREFLGSHHIELAPTVRVESFRQRFYLYLALTKPEERLYLSYSAMDASGKSLRPSILLGELKKLFPQLTAVAASDEAAGIPFSIREARGRLTRGLRNYGISREDSEFLELFRHFMMNEEQRESVEKLVDAAFYAYEERGIGKMAAKALYGTVLGGSVTRLEQYASCAYAHFLNYGLELAERQQYELAAMDIGNLFHDSIDLCFKRMKEQGGDWKTIGEEERKALVHGVVTEVTEEYGNTILKSSARNAWLARKVEKITDRTIWALAEQLKKGDFTPVGFEVSFSAADNLKAMKIPLSEAEALHLKGRIDRMDLCEDEEHIYVKIIDYKSGGTSFDLTALYYGLQLQLVVYMDAALEMEERRNPDKTVIPAGIFYYNISDPVIEREGDMSPEAIDRRILKELRMNGLVNSELEVISHLDHEIETESDVIPVAMKNGLIQEAKSSVAGGNRFSALKRYVNEKLKTEGREILDGVVAVNPYKQGNKTACDYCPYHAVCGFDLKTSGFGFRKFKPLKSEEIWPVIEGEQQDGN